MKDEKGEQVFAGNVDKILAEKIVRRARENAGPHTPPHDMSESSSSGKIFPKVNENRFFAIGLLVAATLLVLATISVLPARKN